MEKNLAVIREVFERRLNGQTQVDIVKWLNGTYYTIRRYQKQPERYIWDKDAVSKVLEILLMPGCLSMVSISLICQSTMNLSL